MSVQDASTGLSQRRPETQGILRLDCGKPRRSSGGSVDFRMPVDQVQPSSPQPSIDRLSVTFRDRSDCSDTSVTVNVFDPGSPPAVGYEMVTFNDEAPANEEDDDYSASVTQILNRRDSIRRGSQRRRKRRPSSPFSQQDDVAAIRRRSSTFTESSGETAISMPDEGPSQEQIFENIRLHKEVLSNVKLQPWGMRRKIKLVKQAKKYVKKHEGELQERLAQSKSTKDIMARFNIVLVKSLQYVRREIANMMTQLIPWELRIKEIESHFGSAVASYFTFLRWMFWVNLVISVLLACFVMIPEVIFANKVAAGDRKIIPDAERPTSKYLVTLWDFEGVLKYSPIFYGYYTNQDRPYSGYRLPFAYFMTGLAVYVYSFVATLRRMAENSRMSKLSEKDDECTFTWKLFSGWDYMIGNSETAHNRVASIVLGFKEALLEETEKKRDEKNWKVLGLRVLVNLLVLSLLTISAYIVFVVVERSTQPDGESTWWRQNEITVSLSIISLIFPIFFEVLGLLEGYHPRKCLRIQLARIMVLNLLNLYTLIFSLFWKISKMVTDLQKFKPNGTITSSPTASSLYSTVEETSSNIPIKVCRNIFINCLTAVTATTLLTTSPSTQSLPNVSNTILSTTELPLSTESIIFSDTPSTTDDYTGATVEYEDDYKNDDFSSSYTSKLSPSVNSLEPLTDATPPSLGPNPVMYALYKLAVSPFIKKKISEQPSGTTVTLRTTSPPSPSPSTTEDSTTTELTNDESTNDFLNDGVLYSLSDDDTTTKSSSETLCAVTVCDEIATTRAPPRTTAYRETTSKSERVMTKELSKLCWETMFGQELVKLTVMDLVLTVVSILFVDFFRAILVRLLNHCWCWDLEKQFPQYGDFKIAENILHLVNNQGMVWMGMFFSPGLPALNLVKLMIMMYLRSWAVLTCNVPHEIVFRASRSNNFYLALLLTMLFLCVLPVGYAIVWIEPSWHCGPFSYYSRIYHIFTDSLHRALPASLEKVLEYIASPAVVIPLLMLLTLIIYYLVSLTTSLREANTDLKIQLRRERTEERRKMFQLVDKKNRKGSGDSDAFARWKQILPDYSPKTDQKGDNKGDAEKRTDKVTVKNRKELISRLLKRAISSGTSDEENITPDSATPPGKHQSPMLDAHKKIKSRVIQEIVSEEKKNVTAARRRSSTPISSAQRSSIASDKIPVIRISKTESEECILGDKEDEGTKKVDSPKRRFKELVRRQIELYQKQREQQREELRKSVSLLKSGSVEVRNSNLEDVVGSSSIEKDVGKN